MAPIIANSPVSRYLKHFHFLLFVVLSYSALGQKGPFDEVSIASPTAGSLGKYADIPVNNHTGIPSIDIPIYTIEHGPLKLPISVSYHASGLRALEPASWVGAGWSLNAGGVITRVVNGAPDEQKCVTPPCQTLRGDHKYFGYFNDYGYNNYLFTSHDINNPNPYYIIDSKNFGLGNRDGEPDMFAFNFNGRYGKFYFNDDRTPMLLPEQDFKIEYEYDQLTYHAGMQMNGTFNDLPSGSIKTFRITTPDGTKYYFGRPPSTGVEPVEITHPYNKFYSYEAGNIISSWFLYKVESVDSQFTITIDYEVEHYGYFTLAVLTRPNYHSTDEDWENDDDYRFIKNCVTGVRIKQIVFGDNKVEFIPNATPRLDLTDNGFNLIDNPNTEAKALDKIRILGQNNLPCTEFDFDTDEYFIDTQTYPLVNDIPYGGLQSDRKRLRLNSIKQRSCDGTVEIPAYRFTYYPGIVSRYISVAQDHWGYYNGAISNTSLVPSYAVTTSQEYFGYEGANREPSFNSCVIGTLKKITYPTGGSSEFEYESNDTFIDTQVTQEILAKSISVNSGSASPVESQFTASGNYYKIEVISTHALEVSLSVGGMQCVGGIVVPADNPLDPNDGVRRVVRYCRIAAGPSNLRLRTYNDGGGTGNATAFITELKPTTVQQNVSVGGLRIKRITDFDGLNLSKNIVRDFTYLDASGKSSGILYSRPMYVQLMRNDYFRDAGVEGQVDDVLRPITVSPPPGSAGCMSAIDATYLISANSIRPMEHTQGNHIGYNEVTVKSSGNGYTVYKYFGSLLQDNNRNNTSYRFLNVANCDPNAPNFPSPPPPFEYKRGQLRYEGVFDESNNLLKETTFEPFFTENPTFTPGFISYVGVANMPGGDNDTEQRWITFYNLSTARQTQLKITEKTRQVGTSNFLTTEKDIYFGSPFHRSQTRVVSRTSTGLTMEEETRYAQDYRVVSCDVTGMPLQNYTLTYNQSDVTYINTRNACSDWLCANNAYYQRLLSRTTARKNYVSAMLSAKSQFQTCMAQSQSNATGMLKPILSLQSMFNNVAVETTNKRNGKVINSMLIEYSFSQQSITAIYPSKIFRINSATSLTDFAHSSNSATQLTTDLRYSEEGSCKYVNGNMVERKDKGGVITSYYWGHGNTLPVVKAIGIDYATLSAAVAANQSNLENLRTYSTTKEGMITVYSYVPLVGMTSMTDHNGYKTTYEYDNLNRLTTVRDHDGNVLQSYEYGYKQ